jgi:hypothetical protein
MQYSFSSAMNEKSKNCNYIEERLIKFVNNQGHINITRPHLFYPLFISSPWQSLYCIKIRTKWRVINSFEKETNICI